MAKELHLQSIDHRHHEMIGVSKITGAVFADYLINNIGCLIVLI